MLAIKNPFEALAAAAEGFETFGGSAFAGGFGELADLDLITAATVRVVWPWNLTPLKKFL